MFEISSGCMLNRTTHKYQIREIEDLSCMTENNWLEENETKKKPYLNSSHSVFFFFFNAELFLHLKKKSVCVSVCAHLATMIYLFVLLSSWVLF